MLQTESSPGIGAAYSGYIPGFIDAHPTALDYAEVPFELLRHDASVASIRERIPLVLHCASLSVASPRLCSPKTVEQVSEWGKAIATPWIGEHLAFITADRDKAGEIADGYAPGEPYNIGYTVSPPMNRKTADRVASHLRYYSSQFSVPLLIENSPLYFSIPSSTMSQAEYVSEILQSCDAGLLLDLAHLWISSETMGFDPEDELDRFPLERTVEVHIREWIISQTECGMTMPRAPRSKCSDFSSRCSAIKTSGNHVRVQLVHTFSSDGAAGRNFART